MCKISAAPYLKLAPRRAGEIERVTAGPWWTRAASRICKEHVQDPGMPLLKSRQRAACRLVILVAREAKGAALAKFCAQQHAKWISWVWYSDINQTETACLSRKEGKNF